MNAGEQSFNHMPFTIDCIQELLVQNSLSHIRDKLNTPQRNEVMKKIHILIQY